MKPYLVRLKETAPVKSFFIHKAVNHSGVNKRIMNHISSLNHGVFGIYHGATLLANLWATCLLTNHFNLYPYKIWVVYLVLTLNKVKAFAVSMLNFSELDQNRTSREVYAELCVCVSVLILCWCNVTCLARNRLYCFLTIVLVLVLITTSHM